MAKRPVLGRGLASLIPSEDEHSESVGVRPEGSDVQVWPIAINRIDAGRLQPRHEFDEVKLKELSQSIQERGILQPIMVRPVGDRYELIAGERRMRAALLAGLDEIPAIVRTVSDREAFEIALVENIQRDDLNAIELATAFQQLQDDFDYTQEEVSRKVGMDRSTVSNHLRLLRLPDDAKLALIRGQLAMGHARALLGVDNPSQLLLVLQEVTDKELSVRETERLVKNLKSPQLPRKTAKSLSVELVHITDRLKRTFQTQVQIVARKKGAGEIRIEYYSPEELNRILDLFPEE